MFKTIGHHTTYKSPNKDQLPISEKHKLINKHLQVQSFHDSISKIISASQFFGILPICNINSKNEEDICYRWFSGVTFYAGLLMVLNFLEFLTLIWLIFQDSLSFHMSGTLSLFTICVLEKVFFWRLATSWSSILLKWQRAEKVFLHLPYTLFITYNLKLRIYLLSGSVLLGALVEHCLLLYNSFDKCERERIQCKLNISRGEALYRRERTHLSPWLPYSDYILPVLEWTNLSLAYPRSFTDCFVICLSCILAMRFRQLYLRILAVQTKSMPAFFWTEIREHFLLLKRLVEIINSELSVLILLAFSNNMYFICFQLFNSFINIGVDFVALLAFWYSLVFAIVRTVLTIYVASTIHDYTQEILLCLRNIPQGSWCLELQRFSEQLTVDVTAISANGFFSLTRKLILAMASTVVTYELMVAGVINKGNIQQITNYCEDYQFAEDTYGSNDNNIVEQLDLQLSS